MNLAEQIFTAEDQQRFASASGDHNPMHVDALLARRTLAGAPVVHGVHLLLRALDALAAARPDLPPLLRLRAQFNKFVYLDEPAEFVLIQQTTTRVRVNVLVGGTARSKFTFEFGEVVENSPEWLRGSLEEIAISRSPMDVRFEEISGRSGRLAFQMTADEAGAMFPAATRWLGARRVAALAASTDLVGMIYPGLHSIYSDLSVSSCANDAAQDFLGFRVKDADARFRTVDHEIAGGGLTGIVNSIARKPPVAQPVMESLAGLTGAREFAGSVALIVGGSRGLGELTAKLIASGGARVIVTWQSGEADAERVAGEIRAGGGACQTLAYDARKPAAEQIALLSETPTHMYYFATPAIRTQSGIFASARLKEFLTVYVDGFWDLAQALRARQPRLSLFYPSSVFVEQRPEGMTEYTMAKAAGEMLCLDMNVSLAPMHVTQRRLPRLPTDQTASVTGPETADAVRTMLALVKEVQSWPR